MKYLIDFDGVIMDTRTLVSKLKKEYKDISWKCFLENLDWKKIYQNSKIINNADKILQEAEIKKINVKIITKVHTINEMQEKLLEIRKILKLNIPVIFVPYKSNKTDIYPTNSNTLLIDDEKKNIDNWVKKGGIGILFTKKKITKQNEINSLNIILGEKNE